MFSAPVFSLGDNTLLKLYNYSGHTQPQPSNSSKKSYLFICFSFEAQTSGLNKICSKHRTLETPAPYTFLAVTVQNVPASSPVARNHPFFVWGWGRRGWGRRVIELINKESGGEGSDRKGEKAMHDLASFISHHPPLVLWVRSYHPTLAHLARLQHPALKVCALH